MSDVIKGKVYVVTCNWSAYGECGEDVFLFSSKEKAIAKFESLILDEQCPDISWVAYNITNGEADEGHVLEKSENSWCFWRDGEYLDWHTDISIKEMEVC